LIAPAIAAVFLMGVFNRKITPKAGEWGLLTGFLIGMFRLFLMVFKNYVPEHSMLGDFLNLNWLIFCIFLFVFTMVLMGVISFFTPKASPEQLQGLTYFSQSKEQRKETRDSWSAWDILTSVVVVGFCVAFYIYFW
jgi:SSS family solute:Na+ symporter